jgi:hypothetical protein
MALDNNNSQDMAVHADINDFDKSSGSFFERLLFNNRTPFLLICLAITIFLGIKALDVRVNADYNDTIPTHQVFLKNYLFPIKARSSMRIISACYNT